MLVVRPVRKGDLPDLVVLAGQAGIGLTTLPNDPDLLEQLVREATHSFAKEVTKPGDEFYLFVLEDIHTGRVIGTTGIHAKVGGFEPFYSYAIKSMPVHSDMLGIDRVVDYLQLVEEHNGPSELGTLFLAPLARNRNNGRLLSLSRFLYMAEHPRCFESEVIVELRGLSDHTGHSPFWDAVGRHFFAMDFPRADYLSVKDKKFIADLMPRHPLYISMLPQTAREAIGQTHPETLPARAILESEGFRFNNTVDIFDAGPTLSAQRKDIRALRESRVAQIGGVVDSVPAPACPSILSRANSPFRCCLADVHLQDNGAIIIGADAALALNAKAGERVRHVPCKPGARP